MEKTPNFNYLRNLETSFRFVRSVALVSVTGSLLFAAGVAFWAFRQVEASRRNVYALANGKSLMLALAEEAGANRPAEARDHVKTFHWLFFSQEPDEKSIVRRMDQAARLGDGSVTRLYADLQEKGFFSQLVQGNVLEKVEVDSVVTDFSRSPYHARTYARQLLVRASTVTVRRLHTECFLREASRTDDNPHGFVIERFRVLDNRDLQTFDRDGSGRPVDVATAP
jgi:conjugative transposon TraK protein